MRNANLKLLIALVILVALVAAAGLIFSGPHLRPDDGSGPLTITATDGLMIPAGKDAMPVDVPADTPWLSIRADGFTYAPVPLTTSGAYTFTHADGSYNTLHVTPYSIRMDSADCSTQDCVNQGEASLDVLEFRPLGGQIICLPHKLIVELIPSGQLGNTIVLEDAVP